jgi:hypothetical protein
MKIILGKDGKMQQWEYLWVRFDGGTILQINNESVVENTLPPTKAETIPAFLSRVGKSWVGSGGHKLSPRDSETTAQRSL